MFINNYDTMFNQPKEHIIEAKNKKEAILKLVGNSIFNVSFTKKDGTFRSLTCRLNVKAHCGDSAPTVDQDTFLIVFDMDRKKHINSKGDKRRFYRNVKIDNIHHIKHGGKKYWL